MSVRAPFYPKRGGNVIVAPAAGSASTTMGLGSKSLRLVNSGANVCSVRVGTGAQTATTADLTLLAGSSMIVLKAQDEDTVAYISAVGTTLHIQPGEGGY